MTVRALASVVVVALITAGCGGASAPPGRRAVHVNGKRVQGDYVLETDASGLRFLVPASVVAGQGNQAFQVAAPTTATVGEASGTITTAAPPYRAIDASATGVVPQSAHVELLATGEPGRRFALSWEDTCGGALTGNGSARYVGAQGLEMLRSPAVTLVKLPPAHGGVSSCYLAATATTTSYTRRLHLAIIDY